MSTQFSILPGRYFITGTDTDVGKTYFCCQWLKQLAEQGYRTTALKPVAAGAEKTENGLRNEDALTLQQHITERMDYDTLNPICYAEPISPHLAAKNKYGASIAPLPLRERSKKQSFFRVRGGSTIDGTLSAQKLHTLCQPALQQPSDYCIIEGAGGWLCPLNDTETLADLAVLLDMPVVMVVAMRLGCLNHALLTVQAIEQSGLKIVGWIANCIEPEMLYIQENIETLQQRLAAPCLGVLQVPL